MVRGDIAQDGSWGISRMSRLCSERYALRFFLPAWNGILSHIVITAADRERQNKRKVRSVGHFGTLKPGILLYDDPSPPSTAETILEIEQHDLERKVDLVLVMGTSLKVPGFKALSECCSLVTF